MSLSRGSENRHNNARHKTCLTQLVTLTGTETCMKIFYRLVWYNKYVPKYRQQNGKWIKEKYIIRLRCQYTTCLNCIAAAQFLITNIICRYCSRFGYVIFIQWHRNVLLRSQSSDVFALGEHSRDHLDNFFSSRLYG